ncbi:MAG: DEAD/DEAH box helicase [Mucilaginibacter polytrichastri]|nr:DEAD/DEAH box helicase [Mucilaginibacter polytrichastri]
MKNQTYGLHPYQQADIERLLSRLTLRKAQARLLYQLPTGGGKTHVFTELVRRFICTRESKALVLTHRRELCRQTARTLSNAGVANTMINQCTRTIPAKSHCYVAMVETLKNRIEEGLFDPNKVGLVIIDEAHHNAFRPLLDVFIAAQLIGVTATPLSSNREYPLYKTYDELITGKSIAELIAENYLAKPHTVEYDVELSSLHTGDNGDYTVSTSDSLYSSSAMLDLVLDAYRKQAEGKKTLIFNHGIFTSREVCRHFEDAGYAIRHLDHHASEDERGGILRWFKKTPDAILTSVSILTTGFDEPGVQCVILNRATTSFTLFHQMIGRGSRYLARKRTFTILDLGNNTARFGPWHDPVDWSSIFRDPEHYYSMMQRQGESEDGPVTTGLRSKFPNTLQLGFDIQEAWHEKERKGEKTRHVIRDAIRQHARMCIENSESISAAVELAGALNKEIAHRVKEYGKCMGKVTRDYLVWLENDYKRRLVGLIKKLMPKSPTQSFSIPA